MLPEKIGRYSIYLLHLDPACVGTGAWWDKSWGQSWMVWSGKSRGQLRGWFRATHPQVGIAPTTRLPASPPSCLGQHMSAWRYAWGPSLSLPQDEASGWSGWGWGGPSDAPSMLNSALLTRRPGCQQWQWAGSGHRAQVWGRGQFCLPQGQRTAQSPWFATSGRGGFNANPTPVPGLILLNWSIKTCANYRARA